MQAGGLENFPGFCSIKQVAGTRTTVWLRVLMGHRVCCFAVWRCCFGQMCVSTPWNHLFLVTHPHHHCGLKLYWWTTIRRLLSEHFGLGLGSEQLASVCSLNGCLKSPPSYSLSDLSLTLWAVISVLLCRNVRLPAGENVCLRPRPGSCTWTGPCPICCVDSAGVQERANDWCKVKVPPGVEVWNMGSSAAEETCCSVLSCGFLLELALVC